MVTVPLLDLKPQYASIKEEVLTAIAEICESQALILGPKTEAMEKDLAAYCQTEFAFGVSSGTDALLIAMMALSIEADDEVITTPYTFFATAGCVARLGAKAIFVDIDPKTFNIDPAKIEEKITPKTKAIIPVHLYGQCADMDPILEIARRHDLAVIEDAAQAIGSEYKGRRAGSIGDVGCFSFYPTKNLGAFGDAGAVTTNDPDLAHRLKIMRVHGMEPRYYHKYVGGNFRIDAIQSAVVQIKLRYLDAWSRARQQNAALYNTMFIESGLTEATNGQPPVLTPPFVSSETGQYAYCVGDGPPFEGHRHIYNQYILRVSHSRDELRSALREQQIGSEIYYPVPLHMQECFADWGYQEGDFPISETAALETLALPIYPDLSEEQVRTAAEAIISFYR